MKPVGDRLRLLLLWAACSSLAGCVVVKPYQREYLSEPVMTPGTDHVESRFSQHWQSSREGASGGFGGAGGGCGCN